MISLSISSFSFSDGNTKMGGAHLTEEGKLKLEKLIFFYNSIAYDKKRIVIYNNLYSREKLLVSVVKREIRNKTRGIGARCNRPRRKKITRRATFLDGFFTACERHLYSL